MIATRDVREAGRQGLIAAAVVWAVTSVPYAFGAWVTPEDMVYTGLVFNVPDHAQYWAWVTAARGGPFISNTMTPEPNPAIFVNGMAWLLALVQRALNLSFPALFQVWRTAAIAVLVPALWVFCEVFARDRGERRRALVIAMAGAGFGWVLVVAKHATGANDVAWPLDIYLAEANTFWTLLAYPYASLALGVQLLVLLAVWWAHRGHSWIGVAAAALGAAFLSFTHAYDLIIVGAVTGAFGCLEWARLRRFPSRLCLAGIAMALCSAPCLAYYAWLTSTDPLWRSVLAQYPNAGVWTPAPPHLVVLMGLPLLLAAVGLSAGRPRDGSDWYLLTWALAGSVLIYLPVVYQVKMLAGWQVPLAILAARGWRDRVVPTLSRVSSRLGFPADGGRREWVVAAVLVLLVAPTNVYLFVWRLVDLARTERPYYFTRDEARALEWLAAHATMEDVVLAPLETGRLVPGYGDTRAYLAHWAMTNQYFEREMNVSRFFDPDVPDAWRLELLAAEGVTLVLRVAPPGDPSVYAPSSSPAFVQVFESPRAQMYRVVGEAVASRTGSPLRAERGRVRADDAGDARAR